MFDHTQKSGSYYLNGHCFISLVINIPLVYKGQIRQLHLPIGYRLCSKGESKLNVASHLVENAIRILSEYEVILLCDSWYTKGSVLDTVKKYSNLNLVGAVRKDTALDELPPVPTGRRGRPRKRGQRLDIKTFKYIKQGKYFVSTKKVMTRLFQVPVYITVTTTDTNSFSSVRVYISTISPYKIKNSYSNKCEERTSDNDNDSKVILNTYHIRWSIEVLFYQHKFFWSFGNYMVRNKNAIERYVNLIAIAYNFVAILPFIHPSFSNLKFGSPQEIRRAVSEQITKELILSTFVSRLENNKNKLIIAKAVKIFSGLDISA